MGTARIVLSASVIALAGCGEGNVCKQACQRMKSCGEAKLATMNCDDPQLKAACDMVRKALAVDCSQATDAACTGEYRAQSERTVRCTLDPMTCVCPRNVCLEACRELKDCAEDSLRDLDCAADKATCDALKQMEQKDCYAISDESCTGAAKTEAERIESCFLDHTTCTCPTQ
jgi:hypothetical protein